MFTIDTTTVNKALSSRFIMTQAYGTELGLAIVHGGLNTEWESIQFIK